LLLAPALLGALLQWPWPVTVALLVPGLSVQITLGFIAGRTRQNTYLQVLPVRTRLILGGLAGFIGTLSTHVRPTYLVPLAFALGAVMVVDPLWRAGYKRQRTHQ
jgi:hypothetical protein